ncbi:MAG: hypothetical protein PHV32_19670, partial [Eubacteriales bacterium]|nr:hypothetical protein [Eubacteriales bacterium]
MAWNNAVVTNNGVAMLRKVLDGETLIIDNAGGGSGTVLPATLMAQTALINKKQTFNVVSATDVTNGKKLNILIANIGLLDGYIMQQVGIWAHVGTDPSTLFAILQDETGIAISPEADLPDFALNFYAVIDFSNESSFELTVDTSALVNVGMMNTSKSEAISEAVSQAATDATEKMTIAETNAKNYVDALEIGGRNLILNSGIPVTNSDFIIQEYTELSDELLDSIPGGYYLFPEGERFTVSLKGTLGEGKTHFAVRTTGAVYYKLNKNGNVHSLSFIGDGRNTFSVDIRAYPEAVSAESTIEWIKLERGDKATDWTPAPEDIEKKVDDLTASDIAYDNVASEMTAEDMQSAIEENRASINELELVLDEELEGKADLIDGKVPKTQIPEIDSKDNTVTFEEAVEDINIASGEKHSILFGKILKSFKTIALTIGNKTSLITTEKDNLVDAINEVKTQSNDLDDEVIAHKDDNANPHNVTKSQVGLGNLDNVKQAPSTRTIT